jgi:hypothetical protein
MLLKTKDRLGEEWKVTSGKSGKRGRTDGLWQGAVREPPLRPESFELHHRVLHLAADGASSFV